ncbi:hypothetical protein Tco_0163058 [Tanacetum coccineum]
MHTRASNSKLVEPLPEPERTLNQRLRRRNRRVPFEQRNEPPTQLRVVYVPILNINYFCHFLDILENYNPIDDEPMWAADRVVALTPGFAITIPETANELAIKGNHLTLVKGNQFDGCLSSYCPVIRVKQKQINLGVGTERITFHMDSAMKHSYSNDDTCFSINVIDEILEEDFDALLGEGSKILYSIKGTILKEKLFTEFDEFIAMTAEEDTESESDIEELPFEKITFNTDYKIKTSLKEPPMDLKLKPIPDNLEYAFLEEPSFLHVIISSQLFEEKKTNSFPSLSTTSKPLLGKPQTFLESVFDIEIKDKKGTENVAADHLSRIENDETIDDSDIDDNFIGETLMEITPLNGHTMLVRVKELSNHRCLVHEFRRVCVVLSPFLDHWYVVPTGRVVVPTGRYVVPAGKVIIIVSPGRLNLVPTGRILSPGSDNDSDDASVHSEATIPQQQRNNQPQYITTVSNNNAKFPYLKKDEYEVWAMKMEYWITNNDMNIWKVIQNGNSLKRTGRDCDGRVIILPPTTADEHIAVQRESKARTTLLQSIPDDHVADFHYMDDARDIWNAVKARFGGNAESKKMRKSMLKQEFSEFRISEAEGLHKGYDRMQKILSQLNQLKAKPEDEDINLKFLRALPSSWSQVALTLKTKGGLELLSFDDLYYKLKTLEVDIKGYSTFSSSQSACPSHSTFVSTTSASKKIVDILKSMIFYLPTLLHQTLRLGLTDLLPREGSATRCLPKRHFAQRMQTKGGIDKQRYSLIQDFRMIERRRRFPKIDHCDAWRICLLWVSLLRMDDSDLVYLPLTLKKVEVDLIFKGLPKLICMESVPSTLSLETYNPLADHLSTLNETQNVYGIKVLTSGDLFCCLMTLSYVITVTRAQVKLILPPRSTSSVSTSECDAMIESNCWTGKVNITPARPLPVPTGKPKVVLGNHIEKVYTGYPRTIVDLNTSMDNFSASQADPRKILYTEAADEGIILIVVVLVRNWNTTVGTETYQEKSFYHTEGNWMQTSRDMYCYQEELSLTLALSEVPQHLCVRGLVEVSCVPVDWLALSRL